jgi:hypothetical protein
LFAKREKQIQILLRSSAGIYGELQAIVGGALRPVAALELPASGDEPGPLALVGGAGERRQPPLDPAMVEEVVEGVLHRWPPFGQASSTPWSHPSAEINVFPLLARALGHGPPPTTRRFR